MRIPLIGTLVLLLAPLSSAVGSLPQDRQRPAVRFEPIRFGDAPEHAYDRPLLPGAEYDPDLPTPDELLGQRWGSRIASHDEVLSALRTWAAASPRASLVPYGRTHEGRELAVCVITSEANQQRLEEVRQGLARLHDPRGLPQEEGQRLARELPACAWMGYGIHGDETSATDAAGLVAYHLIAGRDPEVRALLEEVVVVLDPCLNPDGRERIRAMTRWLSGYRTNLDRVSLHRGRWPYGRGNHFLFDMNRDWMAGVCPETRARWSVLQRWRPQLFVDAHEMGAHDTFLFYPQEKPHNPSLPPYLLEWQGRFADDAGAAFDERGWGYYTREWADAWYPGYSDAWGSLNGAIGMLYEQAGLGGQPLRRPSGVIETYTESVHGQVVASLANLETLRANRAALLTDYVAGQRALVEDDGRLLVLASENPARVRRVVGALEAQGLEVFRARDDFVGRDVSGSDGSRQEQRAFDAERAWVVPAAQPGRRMLEAYFALDPRIDPETLADERARLERGDSSRLYDLTAWDLARQTGVDAWWCTADDPALEPAEAPARGGALVGAAEERAYAWAADATDDAAPVFAARALELGLAVHCSDRPFAVTVTRDGRPTAVRLPRGSFLVRRHENDGDVDDRVARAATAAGIDVLATGTGRAPGATPDLGGRRFHLLARPRVALVTGEGTSSSEFGHLWHHLDVRLGLAATLLEARELTRYDLRPYEVLVLPPGRGMGGVIEEAGEALETWVRGGGTLVACGSSAHALAAAQELTSVRRRRDVLEDLERYEFAARRQLGVDALDADADADEEDAEDDPDRHPDPERQDALQRRFMPTGAILRARVDPRHWLVRGCGDELGVLLGARTSLLFDGRAPVRFAEQERLALAGLVWPEATRRLAGSVWLTREARGHGQVILFATNPCFRGSTAATARAFTNAVVLGPGLGADPVRER